MRGFTRKISPLEKQNKENSQYNWLPLGYDAVWDQLSLHKEIQKFFNGEQASLKGSNPTRHF